MEQGRRSKIARPLEFPQSLSALGERVWLLLVVVLLVILFIPYLRVDLPILQQADHPVSRLLLSLFPNIGVSLLVFVALRWPVWALAFFFATAPLANGLVAWVTLGNPGLHKQAGIFWVEPLFLSIAIGLLLSRVRWLEHERSKGFEASVGFYAGVVVISLALSFRPSEGWWAHLPSAWSDVFRIDQLAPYHQPRAALLILASLLCYRLTVTHLRTAAEIQLVCRGWLVGGLLTGVYGISIWIWRDRGLYRGFESVLDDPNSYASYLVLTLFIAWGTFLTESEPWARKLALLTLSITACMLPVAGSRIAIIAAAISGGIAWTILARSGRSRWTRGTLLAGLASGILLFSLLGGRYAPEEHPDVLSGVKLYAIHRLAQAMDPAFVLRVWRGGRRAISAAGLRMVGERPVFGQGPGTFVRRLGDFYRPWDEGYRPRYENAHNYFIQVAAETGIAGLVGFLWVVATGLVAAFTRNLNGERVRPRLLAIGIVGYLMTAFTGHPLLLSEQAFLFWGSLGILAACTRRAEAASVAHPPTRSLSTPPAL